MELQKLPHSNLILAFGITSVVTFWFCLSGIIFGISTLLLARKALKLHAKNPDVYEGIRKVKAGMILAIIGIVLNIALISFLIYLLFLFAHSFAG